MITPGAPINCPDPGGGGTSDCDSPTVVLLCDQLGAPFLRFVFSDCEGSIESVIDTDLDASPITPVVNATVCPQGAGSQPNTSIDVEILCDDTATPFYRVVIWNNVTGTLVSSNYVTLAFAPYTPTGVVRDCGDRASFHTLILCDSTGTKFIRTFRFNNTGTAVSFVDQTFAGTAFTPTGAVSDECAAAPAQVETTGSVRLTTGQSTTIAANYKSFTVSVRSGTTEVDGPEHTSGSGTIFPEGAWSWNSATFIAPGVVVTCITGECFVTWIEV
jgi:hypothetical protein